MERNGSDAPTPETPNSNTSPTGECRPPENFTPRPFDHEKLDAYRVAREALTKGDVVSRSLPRGYGALADQLRRALLSAFLGVAEGASRTGADRAARFRAARGEASEAAAALEAIDLLRLYPHEDLAEIRILLARLAAMLTRLMFRR
jgi:four helix bundle protein